MRLLLALVLCGSIAGQTVAGQPIERAEKAFKGMELNSWKDQGSDTWMYSLMLGTNRNKSVTEIRAKGVSGLGDLKRQLGRLAHGEEVFWFSSQAFPHPDKARIEEVVQFASEFNVRVVTGQ
jgi:hypothetical protein